MQTTEMTKQAVVIRPGAGRPLNVMGHSVTVKLDKGQTNGDTYVFEVVTPPGLGIPPHVHEREDEVIYVLEGRYEIFLGGQMAVATTGAVLHFPRGIAHGFQNIGDAPGKTLWAVTPGANFEPFFDELGALPPGPPDLAVVGAIFARYGIEILPPPAA